MAGINDVTGDSLISKNNSDKYREGWDRIFGKKKKEKEKHKNEKEKPKEKK